jgi:hypothetical protein
MVVMIMMMMMIMMVIIMIIMIRHKTSTNERKIETRINRRQDDTEI